MGCLFCKMVDGDIPCSRVYEDDHILAFNDIDPQAPFHVLVIPKKHVQSLAELSADDPPLGARLFSAVAEIARLHTLETEGFRVVVNQGARAGQTVDHLHVHILAGRDFGWPPG